MDRRFCDLQALERAGSIALVSSDSFASLLLVLGFAIGQPFTKAAHATIDYARWFTARSYYAAEVEKALTGKADLTVVFDWGSSGYLSTSFFHVLIFDRRGELLELQKMGRLSPYFRSRQKVSDFDGRRLQINRGSFA